MQTAFAFIRGINVGGKNALPMPDLRAACEQAGLQNVTTYIQSGNVLFRAPARTLPRAPTSIADHIERSAHFRPHVILRTLDELQAILDACPLQAEPSKLLVMLLASPPTPAAAQSLQSLNPSPERLILRGRDIYTHFPNGVGKSKLSMATIEKLAATPGTCRNWNTLVKLTQLASALR